MAAPRAGRVLAVAVAAVAVSGCGEDPPATVLEDRVVQRRDIERLPEGTPQRTAMEFARLVQWNDPDGTRARLSERWGLSVGEVASFLQQAGAPARSLGVPRILRTTVRGRQALVKARLGAGIARLDLVRDGGTWKVDRFRVGTVDLPEQR